MPVKILMFLSMFFLHVVDDFYIQGILASMKQKSWWEKNYPHRMYRFDYLAALIWHGFSWTFMIMLPILIAGCFGVIYVDAKLFLVYFIFNWFMHSFVDNAKANMCALNLVEDQLLHVVQIACTAVYFIRF